MQVHQAILTKRAVREFQDTPLSAEAIHTIVNAGRRAQSAKNMQPWHFITIQNKETLRTLSTLGTYAGHLAGAALAVAILTIDPASRFSVMFDAGQSAAYMQLAAWELGVGSCMATIYEPEKARELLGFPDQYHIRVAISFGYPRESGVISAPPSKGGRLPLRGNSAQRTLVRKLDAGLFKHFTDNCLSFFLNLVQVLLTFKTFRIDLVNIFGAGRARREPAICTHHFQPTKRRVIAGRTREFSYNLLASQGSCALH